MGEEAPAPASEDCTQEEEEAEEAEEEEVY